MTRILLVLCLVTLTNACHVHRESTRSDLGAAAAAAGISPAPSVDDLSWLVGAWRGEGLGGQVDEVWTAPGGGVMVGHFRLVRDGAVRFYEIMTLGPIDADGTLGLKVKHFAPDLTGWEEKDAWVTFPVRSTDGGTVEMEGARMRRIDDERMEITVTMSSRDGSRHDEVLRYRRVR